MQNTNDREGIAQLRTRLKRMKPTLVVLEASGGYEREAVAFLAAKAGFDLWQWAPDNRKERTAHC